MRRRIETWPTLHVVVYRSAALFAVDSAVCDGSQRQVFGGAPRKERERERRWTDHTHRWLEHPDQRGHTKQIDGGAFKKLGSSDVERIIIIHAPLLSQQSFGANIYLQ